jgi:hypothetical protein
VVEYYICRGQFDFENPNRMAHIVHFSLYKQLSGTDRFQITRVYPNVIQSILMLVNRARSLFNFSDDIGQSRILC